MSGFTPMRIRPCFLDEVRKVVNDPRVEVRWARDRYRPAGGSSLNTEAFTVIQEQIKKHYGTVVLPTMSTGASDMAQIRSKGIQCYGSAPRSIPKMVRRASVRTAIRSAFSKASYTDSCDSGPTS